MPMPFFSLHFSTNLMTFLIPPPLKDSGTFFNGGGGGGGQGGKINNLAARLSLVEWKKSGRPERPEIREHVYTVPVSLILTRTE